MRWPCVVLRQDVGAGDVRWHEVRRELDAAEMQVERIGERAHQGGFAKPGHAFEQRMASGENADQNVANDLGLPDHDLADFVFDRCAVSRNWLTVSSVLSNGPSFRISRNPATETEERRRRA